MNSRRFSRYAWLDCCLHFFLRPPIYCVGTILKANTEVQEWKGKDEDEGEDEDEDEDEDEGVGEGGVRLLSV